MQSTRQRQDKDKSRGKESVGQGAHEGTEREINGKRVGYAGTAKGRKGSRSNGGAISRTVGVVRIICER